MLVVTEIFKPAFFLEKSLSKPLLNFDRTEVTDRSGLSFLYGARKTTIQVESLEIEFKETIVKFYPYFWFSANVELSIAQFK